MITNPQAGSPVESFFESVESRTLAWPRGRQDLHWHVLFDPAEVEEQLTGPYRELATVEGMHAVPAQWMHMTLVHAGPTDRYTEREIAEVVDLVRAEASQLEPLQVEFSRPAIGRVALEMAGRPGAPSRRLWQAARDAFETAAPGRWPLLPTAHVPHMSLAYAGANAAAVDRTAMKLWLSDHGPGPVTLTARRCALVSQQHDGAHIRWHPLADVPLGAMKATA